ncbi:FACT complex subunit spt16, partial [Spiromyces aspiralis]
NPRDEYSAFKEVDALCFVNGTSDVERLYQGTPLLQVWTSMQGIRLWLFGYEFPNTAIVMTEKTIYVIASPKKVKLLEEAKPRDGRMDWVFLEYTKANPSLNKVAFKKAVDGILNSKGGKNVGILPKEVLMGKFAMEWLDVFGDIEDRLLKVDVSPAVATLLAVKEEDELNATRTAAKLSSCMMRNCFANEMEEVLDEGKKVTHEAFSAKVDSALFHSKAAAKYKFPLDASSELIDWCYTPIIQSGGKYNLMASAVSNEEDLHAGTILCSLGVRYKSYCSNIGRTFLISPTKEQETNYKFLLTLQKKILDLIRPGAKFADVYSKALQYIRDERVDLEGHFVKSCGFAMGMEFRDSTRVISPKSTTVIKKDMVIGLSLGFNSLENPKAKSSAGKRYALLVIDTVIVTDNAPEIITSGCKSLDEMCFYFKDVEAAGNKPARDRESAPPAETSAPATRR